MIRTFQTAGAAAEFAAECKVRKYTDLSRSLFFVQIAVETLGPLCASGAGFISELGRRVASNSGDPRESSFLFQRISITNQRGNAAAVLAYLKSVSDLQTFRPS